MERVGVDLDLDPLAAAGNDRQYSRSCRHDPHVMLELRHIFRCSLSENTRAADSTETGLD